MKPLRLLIIAMLVSATGTVAFGSGFDAGAAPASEPLWVTHVRKFPGGISNGVRVRAVLDAAVQQAQARHLATSPATGPNSAATPSAGATAIRNVQMNDDRYPPLPQNEDSGRRERRPPAGRGRGRERLRERRHSRHANERRRSALAEHSRRTRVPTDRRHVQRRRPLRRLQRARSRVLPCAALLLPKLGTVRGADLQVARQRRDVDARPARRGRRHELRHVDGQRERVGVQRQGIHRDRQHADEPSLRAALRHVHPVPFGCERSDRYVSDQAVVLGHDPEQ